MALSPPPQQRGQSGQATVELVALLPLSASSPRCCGRRWSPARRCGSPDRPPARPPARAPSAVTPGAAARRVLPKRLERGLKVERAARRRGRPRRRPDPRRHRRHPPRHRHRRARDSRTRRDDPRTSGPRPADRSPRTRRALRFRAGARARRAAFPRCPALRLASRRDFRAGPRPDVAPRFRAGLARVAPRLSALALASASRRAAPSRARPAGRRRAAPPRSARPRPPCLPRASMLRPLHARAIAESGQASIELVVLAPLLVASCWPPHSCWPPAPPASSPTTRPRPQPSRCCRAAIPRRRRATPCPAGRAGGCRCASTAGGCAFACARRRRSPGWAVLEASSRSRRRAEAAVSLLRSVSQHFVAPPVDPPAGGARGLRPPRRRTGSGVRGTRAAHASRCRRAVVSRRCPAARRRARARAREPPAGAGRGGLRLDRGPAGRPGLARARDAGRAPARDDARAPAGTTPARRAGWRSCASRADARGGGRAGAARAAAASSAPTRAGARRPARHGRSTSCSPTRTSSSSRRRRDGSRARPAGARRPGGGAFAPCVCEVPPAHPARSLAGAGLTLLPSARRALAERRRGAAVSRAPSAAGRRAARPARRRSSSLGAAMALLVGALVLGSIARGMGAQSDEQRAADLAALAGRAGDARRLPAAVRARVLGRRSNPVASRARRVPRARRDAALATARRNGAAT